MNNDIFKALSSEDLIMRIKTFNKFLLDHSSTVTNEPIFKEMIKHKGSFGRNLCTIDSINELKVQLYGNVIYAISGTMEPHMWDGGFVDITINIPEFVISSDCHKFYELTELFVDKMYDTALCRTIDTLSLKVQENINYIEILEKELANRLINKKHTPTIKYDIKGGDTNE